MKNKTDDIQIAGWILYENKMYYPIYGQVDFSVCGACDLRGTPCNKICINTEKAILGEAYYKTYFKLWK